MAAERVVVIYYYLFSGHDTLAVHSASICLAREIKRLLCNGFFLATLNRNIITRFNHSAAAATNNTSFECLLPSGIRTETELRTNTAICVCYANRQQRTCIVIVANDLQSWQRWAEIEISVFIIAAYCVESVSANNLSIYLKTNGLLYRSLDYFRCIWYTYLLQFHILKLFVISTG